MTRTHLPLIPEPILRRHHVYEPHDTRFRACARLLQSLWRAGPELRMGRHTAPDGTTRKLGSRISDTAGRAGGNFLSRKIARLARRELCFGEPGAMFDQQRLLTNLLSSQPLVFNALGPLRLDQNLADAMLVAMCPDLAGSTVDTVLFEHSPGRAAADLTGDHTAWDAAIPYTRADGTKGIVAIEMKYSESGWEPIKDLRVRYADLMPATRLFVDPTSPDLRKRPLQQLMREHVLLQAAIMRGDYAEGRFIVILPELNAPMQSACRRYAAHLAKPEQGKAGFGALTLEAFIDLLRNAGEGDHAAALHGRYCDWDSVEQEIETSLSDAAPE